MTRERFENGQKAIERWNRVFQALSADPRRQLIASLVDSSPNQAVPLPESAMNPNVPADPETLKQELHHCHLPMLGDQGFIEWEAEPLTASRGPYFDEVAVVWETLSSTATEMPDSLVVGYQRLERERQESIDS